MKLVLLRVMEEDESVLPERPEEPLPSECCGSGCAPCVLDVYQDQLDTWRTLHDMTPQQRAAYGTTISLFIEYKKDCVLYLIM